MRWHTCKVGLFNEILNCFIISLVTVSRCVTHCSAFDFKKKEKISKKIIK